MDALIEATARILVAEGFGKASTNRIAEVAGVSIGTLYQYFPSKEALVVAVAQRHHRQIMAVVDDALGRMDSLHLEDAVRGLVVAAIEGHRVDPELHCVLTEQIPRIGPLEDVRTAAREAQARFKAYLESRGEELTVANCELAAYVCATCVEALAHNAVLHHAEPFAPDTAEAIVEETTRLLVGYLKRP